MNQMTMGVPAHNLTRDRRRAKGQARLNGGKSRENSHDGKAGGEPVGTPAPATG